LEVVAQVLLPQLRLSSRRESRVVILCLALLRQQAAALEMATFRLLLRAALAALVVAEDLLAQAVLATLQTLRHRKVATVETEAIACQITAVALVAALLQLAGMAAAQQAATAATEPRLASLARL
jgi:hypothetical protein